MKKLVFALLLAVLSIGMAGAFEVPNPNPTPEDVVKKGKIKIGISVPTADHGWTGGIVWWVKKAISDWEGVDKEIEFTLTTSADPASQVSAVEDMMTKEIDGLVILPHDSAPLTPVCEEAIKAGIYTVVIDRALIKDIADVYIAGNNPGLGKVSAEWLAKELGGKGKIVAMGGIPCVIDKERNDAFKAVMAKYPDIEILDFQPANWSTQKGLELMENYLQKYDEIDAVFCQDDDVLVGVLQAYEESGRDDVKVIMGGAGSKLVIKKIMDGDPLVKSTVTYPPSMAATAVSLCVYGLRNERLNGFYQNKIPSKIILAAELITKDNAKEYYVEESVY